MKNMSFYANYHTHTYRCKHAEGIEEDYVVAAIKAGIKVLGISDHIFLPGVSQGVRGDYSELNDYIEAVNELKIKYKDQIKIYLGFEAEYYPRYVDYYKELKSKYIDYLILGQHCRFINEKLEFYFSWKYQGNAKIKAVKEYAYDLIKGIKTGLFSYVCHPDLFLASFNKFTLPLKITCKKICRAAKKYNVPLEVNLARISHMSMTNLDYPCGYFWKIASKYKVKAIFGIDAHHPEEIINVDQKWAFAFAKKYNLNILKEIPIKEHKIEW